MWGGEALAPRCIPGVRTWGCAVQGSYLSNPYKNLRPDELSVRRLEERFRLATDAAEIGVWDIDLRTGKLTWDSTMHALFEVDPDNFKGVFEDWRQCLHPEDVERSTQTFEQSIHTGEPFDDEFRIVTPDGRVKHVRARAQVFTDPKGVAVRVVGVNYDITTQKTAKLAVDAAARRAEQAHDRLTRLTNNVPAGLFEYREGPDGSISFPFFNTKLPELLGVSAESIRADGAAAFHHLHPDDFDPVVAAIADSKANLTPFIMRYRIQHPENGLVWYKASTLPMREADGGCLWYGGLTDITQDVAYEESLREAHAATERMRVENERQALHDGLTGLPNRRFYDQELLARMQARDESRLTLVRLDLDHFKYVNDTLGHEAGDSVLQRVAEALTQSLGPDDFAARIGGDEFSILMAPGAGMDEAQALIGEVRARLAQPHYYNERQCRFGASFGVAQTDALDRVRHDIQMFADAALYKAKSGGRNRVEVFTPQMHEQLLEDRRLATEIQEGLERGEFVPYFQPQVCAQSGKLAGAEVLLRWNHPGRGVLTPCAFMHVAEHLRLVPDLDQAMMAQCQAALLEWAYQGVVLPRLSFNVSAGRLEDPAIIEMARRMAAGPTQISFELLESILIEDEGDLTRFQLDTIRECGIELEIDDFGSGHASIVSLMQVQPSTLKIDQRLIQPIVEDTRARDLVRAIVHMAKCLKIRTIAEGVETEAQADVLRKTGCDVFQGYLYGRPMEQAVFGELARSMLDAPDLELARPAVSAGG